MKLSRTFIFTINKKIQVIDIFQVMIQMKYLTLTINAL